MTMMKNKAPRLSHLAIGTTKEASVGGVEQLICTRVWHSYELVYPRELIKFLCPHPLHDGDRGRGGDVVSNFHVFSKSDGTVPI